MARFKHYDYRQTKMLPVRFEEQILPGTFEYTLNRLIDESIDLSVFEARYRNDDGGAPAYDPALLLKVFLLAYSRGITSSRQIERLCRENVLFMAISADSQPHFTTIAHFIATLEREITKRLDAKRIIYGAHPGFAREVLAFDTRRETWRVAGQSPFPAQVTTIAVAHRDGIIIPSGEIKPGIRTPAVIRAKPLLK